MKQTDLWAKVNTNPDFFPTPDQELLLHASLDQDGARMARAWETWRSRVDIERLDAGSHRLLPLLYRNLMAHGMQDPVMSRIKGVYRRTWYENQLLFNRLSRVLRVLNQAGIKTMVLKGAAVSLGHYLDGGVRPMEDFDVLVPYKEVMRGIGLIEALGYRPAFQMPEEEVMKASRHAWDFIDELGYHFDFHWNAFYTHLGENADADFWSEAIPMQVNDQKTLMLCPTDQLLHVCSHGAIWSTIPPIRWVSDAMAILRSSKEGIDWSRLLIQARRTRQTLAVVDTLEYLRDRFDVAVPSSLLRDLRETKTTFLERSLFWAYAHSPEKRGLTVGFLLHVMDHVKSRPKASLWRTLLDFPAYLCERWELRHSWEIPGYIVSNGVRRIWERLVNRAA
jgi:hypothetical protein